MLRRYPVGFRRNGPDLIEARTPVGRDRQPAEAGVQLSPSDAAPVDSPVKSGSTGYDSMMVEDRSGIDAPARVANRRRSRIPKV